VIEKIKVSNTASYDETGIEIDNLKKINFIYGANGSGKTTISNLLADENSYSDCSIEWEHGQKINTLVYNKKFRDDNFGNTSIAGVFTLGKATAEKKKNIEDKRAGLEEIQQEGIAKKQALETQKKEKETKESDFKENVWKGIYKKYKLNFKEAFKGSLQKESFKDKLLLEFDKNTSNLLTFEELKEKAGTIFGKAPETILCFENITFDKISQIENQTIWNEKIIGKSDVNIAQLIQTLNLNDWVNKGREYLQNDNKTCPFCQEETITESFKNQLENYFDESFTNNIETIKSSVEKYKLLTINLINKLESLESSEKNNQKTKIELDSFSAFLKTLSSQFNANRVLLDNKIKEPSRSIKLTSTLEQLEKIEAIITNANIEIQKHNDIVDNFQTEKSQLTQSIWKFIIDENTTIIEEYNTLISGLDTGINNLTTQHKGKQDEYRALSNEIKKLTKNGGTSIQPTINSINTTLEQFGFLNFSIMESKEYKNQYQIQRENGELATNTLSEGEITFITFLYFMRLAKGSTDENAIPDDRVLVVDDPISSLDSNVLFIVSTLLKEIIKNTKNDRGIIKQVLVLTHNVYFHKEASFIDGRTQESNDIFYWILRQNNKISSIECFEGKNPIKNSYELLWQELQNSENNSSVTLQNTMRRIIEHYFKILGQYGDDDLIDNFHNNEDKQVCRSLISWINDGSHVISDDLYIENQESISTKYLKVFEDIFKFTNHKGHYNMMMQIEQPVNKIHINT
jgi:wobble nucleotide-excising tRNase